MKNIISNFEVYEKEIEKNKKVIEIHNAKLQNVWDEFRNNCFKCMDDELTKEQKGMIYSAAYNEWLEGDMSDFYDLICEKENFVVKILKCKGEI